MQLLPALIIFGLIGLVFVLLTRRARKQSEPIAAFYQGTISWLTDAVRFSYRGAQFALCRMASGGGLGGTGYYCTLVLDLDAGLKVVVAPSKSVKYVYAFSIPDQHSWVTTAGAKILVAGAAHSSIALRLSDPVLAPLLHRVFPRDYSTATVKRQVRIEAGRAPRFQWTLELTGMPREVYERPEVLQPILDDALRLRELLIASLPQ